MTNSDSQLVHSPVYQTPKARQQYALGALDRYRRQALRRGIYPRHPGLKARKRKLWDEEGADAHQDDYDDRSQWRNRPGIARSKTGTGRSKYDPQPMNRIIRDLTHSLGWSRTISVASIAARWNDIIGEVNAEHCIVEEFDESVLVIRASSTAWANQMRILLPVVERRINDELGEGIVEKVIIRGPASPSWKKGRWSVKGRGPRDTYG